MTVMTSDLAKTLKDDLEEIIDDDTDGQESGLVCKRWLKKRKMKDAYEDDLETAGPGLVREKPEGQEMSTGTIRQGYFVRYWAKTFGLKILITEEMLEDGKYDEAIRAARRLKRALYKTLDIDCTQILVRMFNTSYPGGDNVPLGSASHTLAHGGTWSNLMGTPASPSTTSIATAGTAVKKYPGHDGTTEGFNLEKVLCPVDQEYAWSEITKSTHRATLSSDSSLANFNEINVANSDMNLTVVANKYWDNTTTHWAVLTDAPNKISYRMRREPRNRTWVENSQEIMCYSISARWARGHSDARSIYCVQAT